MNLSNNFAQALRICGLYFNSHLPNGDFWHLSQHKKGFVLRITPPSHSGGVHTNVETLKMTDNEILRAMDAALPPGELSRYFVAGSQSAYAMGMGDRLRRAYEEPDLPRPKYEKPLHDHAKRFFSDVVEALEFQLEGEKSRSAMIVRRAQNTATYSPMVASVVAKLPFGENLVKEMQLVADPSPYSDMGWSLRINPLGFTFTELQALHDAHSIVVQRLQDKGYTLSPTPWVGQIF